MSWRAALAVAVLSAALAGAVPAVSDDDARRIDRGETVLHQRPVEGFPWPEVVTYRRSTASPTAVMAVWADIDAQASWVPELVASRVVARETANVFRVLYEYEVAGPNERYTSVITITRDGDGWHARWTLVTARYMRRLEGALRVLQRGDGSVVSFRSLVDPGMLGATFGTPESVGRSLAATTEALTARAERLVTSEPRRVTELVEQLNGLARADR